MGRVRMGRRTLALTRATRQRLRRGLPLIVGGLALGVAISSAGYALGSGGTIHACASKKTGALRLASRCKKGEKGIAWGIQGPPGDER
jgi:hypothetical protein